MFCSLAYSDGGFRCVLSWPGPARPGLVLLLPFVLFAHLQMAHRETQSALAVGIPHSKTPFFLLAKCWRDQAKRRQWNAYFSFLPPFLSIFLSAFWLSASWGYFSAFFYNRKGHKQRVWPSPDSGKCVPSSAEEFKEHLKRILTLVSLKQHSVPDGL